MPSAIGIPDRSVYGDPASVRAGQLLDWVVQRHKARRAGEHYDVRFGTPESGLYSWAVRKGVPGPGKKHLAVQQPLHEYAYKDFRGEIPSGYGAGTVTTHDTGHVLVTKVTPNGIHFSTAHRRFPERFVLTRGKDAKKWLLINTTPTKVVPHEKLHYKVVEPEKAEAMIESLRPGSSVQAKIDGAAGLTQLLDRHFEVLSYRTRKDTGGPIFHTERVTGGRPEVRIPPALRGTVLRGEIYGTQDGLAIPPQRLGGLLNAALGRSLAEQARDKIEMKNLVFDVERFGKKNIPKSVPYPERLRMAAKALRHLPPEYFHLPEEARTPEAAKSLWDLVRSGKHPLTREGLVIHPPTGTPAKVKLRDEFDVHLRDVFPGLGKYHGVGAGGFRYSWTPTGPIVGHVGTGLSDTLRKDMLADPAAYLGRVARVSAQEKLPSGALRAPALIALHEG
jgi:hypothetical protein